MTSLPLIVGGYLAAVNALALGLFAADKRRAAAGTWRVPEARLIGVAALGGWLGAKAGQRAFRHKTRKQPFGRRLNAAGLAAAGIALAMAATALSPGADARLEARLRAGAERLAQALAEGRRLDAGAAMPRRFGPGSGEER